MNYSISTDPYAVQVNEEDSIEMKDAFFLANAGTGMGSIVFGTAGADAAEDADVIWHEYGHAILHHQGRFRNQNLDGLGEGFGDWFAAVMSVKMGHPEAAPCIAEWFSSDMPEAKRNGPCLRSLENNKHYPEDLVITRRPGQADVIDVHASSLIIGGALWEATKQIGVDRMVEIVLEGNFYLSGTARQPEAAQKYAEAAQRLGHDREATILTAIFQQRGLIQ
jgi:Zn-dependent metalloprotease